MRRYLVPNVAIKVGEIVIMLLLLIFGIVRSIQDLSTMRDFSLHSTILH